MCEREITDTGTPELARHKKNSYQRIIDLMLDKGIISEDQHYAGNRLFVVFEHTPFAPNPGISRYDDSPKGISERETNYELEYMEAIMSVDPYERTLVRNVVCYNQGLTDARDVKLIRRGLTDLKKYWDGKK
jgi:uncharacterized protein (DUF2164 family)